MDTDENGQIPSWVLTLEDLFDSIPIGLIIMDKQGKIMMFNRTQEQVTRIDRKKIIGTYYHEAFKDTIKQLDKAKHYWDLLKNGKSFSIIFHELIPQFHDLALTGKGYGVPLLSGKGFMIASDFSDEMKLDKHTLQQLNFQLAKSSAFLQNLLDSSPNAVIVTNEEGFISTSNKTAERLFGLSREDLAWRHISLLMESQLEQSEYSTLAQKKTASEFNLKKNNKQIFPARVRLSYFDAEEDESGSWLFIIEDITYEKSIEFSLSERLQFEQLLSELFSTFVDIKIDEIDGKINYALKQIGQILNIDRCYLSQFERLKNMYLATHAWAADGITAIPIGLASEQFPWLFSELTQKKTVQFERLKDISESAHIDQMNYRKLGTKSQLTIPLIDDRFVIGCFSMDQIQHERTWNPDLVNRLQIVAEVMRNILSKKQSDENLHKAYQEIKQLKDRLENERNYLREEIKIEHNYENIIGQSQSLQYALYKVEQVAPTDSTVLLLGETGTGKELLARAIHNKSLRKNQPLIKLNCASLHTNLIESEIFGHEKGAFTGAHSVRKGRFELADGATLFLDEIGELPLETQAKLLRVLQEGQFERLGSSTTMNVDVRIIAATNRNLDEAVEEGRFRNDLWYRLNVFPITAPPLRRRKEDIPLLVNWLVDKYSRQMGKKIDNISGHTMEALESYSWPGNVRELENVIERAVISTQGNVLDVGDKLQTNQTKISPTVEKKPISEIERSYILETLEQTRWRIEGKSGAAKILGLTPSSLRRRMAKYNIQRP